MSSTGWCGATVLGEAYPHSPPERAQERCQTRHHGNTELCKGICPRPASGGAVSVSCGRTRGVIFHKIWFNWNNIQWFSGAGCEISLTQWVSIHHCRSYCSTQINPFYYFLIHHHFDDPPPLPSHPPPLSTVWGQSRESNGVNDLFTPGDAAKSLF